MTWSIVYERSSTLALCLSAVCPYARTKKKFFRSACLPSKDSGIQEIKVLQAQKRRNNNRQPIDDEESDDDENSTSQNRGRKSEQKVSFLLNLFLDLELSINENISRHRENRTIAATRDQNMTRKLEVISLFCSLSPCSSLLAFFHMLFPLFLLKLSKMNSVLFKTHTKSQGLIVSMKKMCRRIETNTKH